MAALLVNVELDQRGMRSLPMVWNEEMAPPTHMTNTRTISITRRMGNMLTIGMLSSKGLLNMAKE
jgi:hypothetical protein